LTALTDVGAAVLAAADKKARDIAVIDVGDFLAITDYFVICSGQSDRQVKTIAEEIEAKLKEIGVRPLRSEGNVEGGWLLIDYGVFVVHVFTDEARAFYDLERLWKDAPRPDLPELDEVREALGS
jgi:ribosome-associated protein